MPDQSPEVVVANRQHRIYEIRQPELNLNTLALYGGRPYIDARLSRLPGESAIDWAGSKAPGTEGRFNVVGDAAIGRKERAYLVNSAGRIAEKIRQYVFAKPPSRKGVDPQIAQDITRQGDSIDQFMGEVLKNIVATKWCWIGIDAPLVSGPISIQQAQAERVRPYWNLYTALDVVDWHMDGKGELTWLLTEGIRWDNPNPFQASVQKDVRRLWLPGKVVEYVLKPRTSQTEDRIVESISETEFAYQGIPFVPVGEISSDPHWFDDVEDIQKAGLDLESSLDTLFFKCVFGQMILPRSVAEDPTGENEGQDLAQRVAAIVGLSNAILEGPDDKGTTRYIGPKADGIAKIQEEIERKRSSLFDVVGLHLGFSKNFSESSESKQMDQLDPQAVLKNYAQQIREAERKAWKLTAEWDSSVTAITPEYADKFRVTNIYEDFKGLTLAGNADLPDSARRLVARGLADAVLEVTAHQPSAQEYEKLIKDVSDMDFEEPLALDAASMAGKVVAGVNDQATDDGEGVRPSGAE